MPYRIFMTIQRGTMDKTAVCVFPWERPILEEIHGGGAQVVEIEQMASLKGASKVVTVALKNPKAKLAPDLQAQLEAMSRVERAANPFNNLEEEFNRLAQKYGMHAEVKMPVVEKVFGSPANFRMIVQAYRTDTPPKQDPMYPETDIDDDAQADTEAADLAPSEMTATQLKAALDAREVKYAARASRDELEALLTEQLATA